MNEHGVQFCVSLTIHENKLAEFERIAQEMTAGTKKEPGALGYEWYFSSDRKRCRLVENYADANATLAHIEGFVVQTLVPKLLEVSSIEHFEVYGDTGPKAAAALGAIGAEIFQHWRGLGR